MTNYQSKNQVVQAQQFNPPQEIPPAIMNVYGGPDGRYAGELDTPHGRIRCYPGDWVVRVASGNFCLKDKCFNELFETINNVQNVE